MPKAYSQDLRDRVIDAVKRGEMSRRAAARRYEISESVAIKWLERVERDGAREPVRSRDVIECGAGCDYRVAAEIDPGPAAERVEPLIPIEIDLPWGTFIQRRVNRT
jgi:transposase-like protein